MPISEGAIVVIQAASPAINGAASFSYVVVGGYYSWFDKPFVNIKWSLGGYYIFLTTLWIAFLIICCVMPTACVASVVASAFSCCTCLLGCYCCKRCCCGGGGKPAKPKAVKSTRVSDKRGSNATLDFSPPGGKSRQAAPPKLSSDSYQSNNQARRDNLQKGNESQASLIKKDTLGSSSKNIPAKNISPTRK